MSPPAVFLSPALPSELLSCIITHHGHPTTLIICSPRAEFLASLAEDVLHDRRTRDDGVTTSATMSSGSSALLAAPLVQVAVARHIRMVFVPSVSHLRAFLSVFSPEDSKVPVPPPPPPPPGQVGVAAASGGRKQTEKRRRQSPLLLVYGFLSLHRDTSEWSAQGLSNTAAALIGAASSFSFRAVIVESVQWRRATVAVTAGNGSTEEERDGVVDEVTAPDVAASTDAELAEMVPVLSGSARRTGPEVEDGGWAGRTVEVQRVLGRWFYFQQGAWAETRHASRDGP